MKKKKEKKGFFRNLFGSKKNKEDNPLLIPANRTIKNSQVLLNNVENSNGGRILRNSPFLLNGSNNIIQIDTQMLNKNMNNFNEMHSDLQNSPNTRSFLDSPAVTTNNVQMRVKPVGNLLDIYLKQEGIDRRYSNIILQELSEATDMNNDQLNQAAHEILIDNPLAATNVLQQPSFENDDEKFTNNF